MPPVIPRRSGLFALALATLLGGCAVSEECPTAACRLDSQLAQQVLDRVNAESAFKADHLRVQSHDGVVYLYGIVDTPMEYSAVEEIARKTPNVLRVVNMLSLPVIY
jgi:osmotically-inducible protein OsmY